MLDPILVQGIRHFDDIHVILKKKQNNKKQNKKAKSFV